MWESQVCNPWWGGPFGEWFCESLGSFKHNYHVSRWSHLGQDVTHQRVVVSLCHHARCKITWVKVWMGQKNNWGVLSGQRCGWLTTGVSNHHLCSEVCSEWTSMASFDGLLWWPPFSNHLSPLSKMWTLEATNECPFYLRCQCTAESCPTELALLCYTSIGGVLV